MVTRSGRVINRPDRLDLYFSFVSCVDCHENCIGRRKCGILGNIGHVIKMMYEGEIKSCEIRSWYTHVCLFVPHCPLLKSFRIQKWAICKVEDSDSETYEEK